MRQFDHEKLNVYQTAVIFVAWSSDLLTDIPKNISVYNQFDRASTSIPLNIAEGNGKYTPADRCRFFDIARGSALECAVDKGLRLGLGLGFTITNSRLLFEAVNAYAEENEP